MAEENAYANLKNLCMVEDRIDEYIAHFKVLLVRAGWNRGDKGSIDIFFNGLTNPVQRKILLLYAILPVTLDEWQTAVRQIVQRYRLMDIKIGPWKPRDPKPNLKFGWNQKGQFRRAQDPDAMEVDATAIDVSTAKPKVRCFFCNNEGHIKKDCCKFKALQKKEESAPPKKAKARAVTIEEDKEEGNEIPPAYDLDSLMVHIKNMKIEDCDSFIDCLLVQDTEDYKAVLRSQPILGLQKLTPCTLEELKQCTQTLNSQWCNKWLKSKPS